MLALYDQIYSALLPVYGDDEARALTFWVLEECGYSRTQILMGTERGCKDTKNIPNTETIIARLLKKEPIQYIFGHTDWAGLRLRVTPATLIPRPETAELVELIAREHGAEQTLRVLDIGTGSGCIAIALRRRHPSWQVSGLDISPEALAVAQENAAANNVPINWIQADFLDEKTSLSDALGGPVDILVSNPPYIRCSERASMSANVLDYEPSTALFVPDSDPLLFYRRIAQSRLGRYLYLEVNEQLAYETAQLLVTHNYTSVTVLQDAYGKDRFVCAERQ